MNEDLAIKIFKQVDLEVDVGGCKNCPRKDKNKTCIGCLDEAKDVLLNYIDNLQNRIDKAIEFINKHIRIDDEYPAYMEMTIEERNELLDILKGDDEN